MNDEECIVELTSGATKFRSTVVKPYYRQEDMQRIEPPTDDHIPAPADIPENQRRLTVTSTPRRSPRHHLLADYNDQYINAIIDESFISRKEVADQEMSRQLRMEGVITTPGLPFEQSDMDEIDALISKGVFEFIAYDPVLHKNNRIFNSRLVHELKKKATIPFEKSRLVIQAYDDQNKQLILTQSPTIQRVSQRLIAALAPSLRKLQIELYIRDIIQAYVASKSRLSRLILANPPKEMITNDKLRRMILARLPPELRKRFGSDIILKVVLPLYGIPEAGTHWWVTYYSHHRDKLHIVTSTYDPCFLISMTKDSFGVVGMQTDDTLILCNSAFADKEEEELKKAGLQAKPREKLDLENPLIFNGGVLQLNKDGSIKLTQKGQGARLKLATCKDDYREQRARAAYIASTCQPEALFDLSIAAQHVEPSSKDIATLNKRIQWQIDNQERGVNFVPFDLSKAKLFVFVDGSFANNQDMSSQLGYAVVIGNERDVSPDEFELTGNLFHWSSTKSKRVTRHVLASEIYAMVLGVDIGIAVSTTLAMIVEQLGLPEIPMIVCTDSYSLYECLVKLGTTAEKRLMIDIMSLRQSYERREIMEIRWIDGKVNPADAMTKSSPNKALETLMITNCLRIHVDGWVDRSPII
ncbi:hypothetical protein K3495_g14423 [Podosphaera aphanis]|nr:hypothetical protein K3495_g14423 [Podosphaera aphanis]